MSVSSNIGQEFLYKKRIDWSHRVAPTQHVEFPYGRNVPLNGTIGVSENTSGMTWNTFNNKRGGALEKDVANRDLVVLSSREIGDGPW